MLTREKLDGLFDMPSKAAARVLGISNNHLKRCCRKVGIDRWPYRKIQSLKNLIGRTDSSLKREINSEIEKIRKDPNRDVSEELRALTALSYKHAFVTRQHSKETYDTPDMTEDPPDTPAPPPETPKRAERRLKAFPIVVVERPRERPNGARDEPVMIPVAAMQLGEWRETLCTPCVRSRPTRVLPFFPVLSLYNTGCCNKHLVVA